MAVITYKTPGVYIEEVPSGARPIQAVGTSTAGFVGLAPNTTRYVNQPVAVNNWAEFRSRFMAPEPELIDAAANAQKELEDANKVTIASQLALNARCKDAQKADAEYKTALENLKQALEGVQPPEAVDADYRDALDKVTLAISAVGQAQSTDGAYRAVLEKVIGDLEGIEPDPTNETAYKAALEKVRQGQNAIEAKCPAAQAADAGYNAALETLSKNQAGTKDKQDSAKTKAATAEQSYPDTFLSDAVYGFFLNGGTRCWIVNVGSNNPQNSQPAYDRPISGHGGTPVGLDILEQVDEVAIVAAPGYTDADSYEAIRSHCEKLGDRVGILDGPEELDDEALYQMEGVPVQNAAWTMPDRSDRGQITLYIPWLEISAASSARSNAGGKKLTRRVAPSGYIAGVWARSDATRGVHKAPANESLRGVLGLQKQITHEEQGSLNDNGVNVIRYFTNEGHLVWGARTLSRDALWKYINIRRLFNMIEESIRVSTRWIVFEPNDRPLWQAIRRDVTAFLMGFWRDGALMGRTPEEAFYVKCDEETNPIESIREGRVVIEIGLSPVYPAEFVIFKISQFQAGAEIETQAA